MIGRLAVIVLEAIAPPFAWAVAVFIIGMPVSISLWRMVYSTQQDTGDPTGIEAGQLVTVNFESVMLSEVATAPLLFIIV